MLGQAYKSGAGWGGPQGLKNRLSCTVHCGNMVLLQWCLACPHFFTVVCPHTFVLTHFAVNFGQLEQTLILLCDVEDQVLLSLLR